MTHRAPSGREFHVHCELIDVTSLHRPDTSWHLTDRAGHDHRWYIGDAPARDYSAGHHYHLPTLHRLFDHWEYDRDGERFAIYRWECPSCGETIEPGFTSDTTIQYVSGLRSFAIDGVAVDEPTFRREWEIEYGTEFGKPPV